MWNWQKVVALGLCLTAAILTAVLAPEMFRDAWEGLAGLVQSFGGGE